MKSFKNRSFTKPMQCVAAAICLGLILFFVFSAQKTQLLPPDILGEWSSDDPQYQPCFIKIRTNFFIIGGADGNVYPYGIKSITEEATTNSKEHYYTLLCEDTEGLELEFRLYYNEETRKLSFKNQRDVIWFKEKKE